MNDITAKSALEFARGLDLGHEWVNGKCQKCQEYSGGSRLCHNKLAIALLDWAERGMLEVTMSEGAVEHVTDYFRAQRAELEKR